MLHEKTSYRTVHFRCLVKNHGRAKNRIYRPENRQNGFISKSSLLWSNIALRQLIVHVMHFNITFWKDLFYFSADIINIRTSFGEIFGV